MRVEERSEGGALMLGLDRRTTTPFGQGRLAFRAGPIHRESLTEAQDSGDLLRTPSVSIALTMYSSV